MTTARQTETQSVSKQTDAMCLQIGNVRVRQKEQLQRRARLRSRGLCFGREELTLDRKSSRHVVSLLCVRFQGNSCHVGDSNVRQSAREKHQELLKNKVAFNRQRRSAEG